MEGYRRRVSDRELAPDRLVRVGREGLPGELALLLLHLASGARPERAGPRSNGRPVSSRPERRGQLAPLGAWLTSRSQSPEADRWSGLSASLGRPPCPLSPRRAA